MRTLMNFSSLGLWDRWCIAWCVMLGLPFVVDGESLKWRKQ